MQTSARAATQLTSDPIISGSLNESLARMLRNAREKTFKAGEVIYRAHADAEYLYLIEHGSIEVVTPDERHMLVKGARFGEEAATDVPHYLSDTVALTDVVTFAIPRHPSLVGLNQYNPDHKAEFYFSLLATFGGERVRRASAAQTEKPTTTTRDWIEAAGWLLAILVPLGILVFGGDWGFDREVRTFLAIFSAAIVMWVFACSTGSGLYFIAVYI